MADLIIDSSITAAWCFPDEHTDFTNSVLKAVIATPLQALAPRLWAYEIRNSVLTGARRKRITLTHAREFLQSLNAVPISLADPPSFDAVFSLASHYALTVYDAAYLDLAMREGLPIVSLDSALMKAARDAGIAVFNP